MDEPFSRAGLLYTMEAAGHGNMGPEGPGPVLRERASRRAGSEQEGLGFLDERFFRGMLERERKRSRRSGKPQILILVSMTGLTGASPLSVPGRLERALASRVRETDVRGWYLRNAVAGILFTDLRSAGSHTREILFGKTMDALSFALEPDELRAAYMTFHTFPADLGDSVPCGRFDVERVHESAWKGVRCSTPLEAVFARICGYLGMKSCR
jgi:hypothetical protein